MSGSPWFRLYSEIVDDPKMGDLTDFEFRIWIQLLCLATSHGKTGSIGMTIREASWRLRCDISVALAPLVEERLIIIPDNKIIFVTDFIRLGAQG